MFVKAPLLPRLIYILLVLLLSSCGQIKNPEFKSIENVQVSKMGLRESILTLNLHYFNPNKTSLKLKSAEGDAWIENNFLGHFTMDTLIHIPGNGDFRLPVKLQVDMSKILTTSLLTLLAKETMIKVDGKARVGKGFIYINYPIHYEGKQKLGEMLR